jgi:hypothetical protein
VGGGEGREKLLSQIDRGPVPTYRVNTHEYRKDIIKQTADSRQRCYRSIVYVPFNVLVGRGERTFLHQVLANLALRLICTDKKY